MSRRQHAPSKPALSSPPGTPPPPAWSTMPAGMNQANGGAMTAVLFQTGVSRSKDKELLAAANEILETHRSSHRAVDASGSSKAVPYCRPCSNQILDLFLDRYSSPKQEDWFKPLAATYLSDLPQLIDDAKQNKIPPKEIDDTIYRVRRAWYASKLRVLVPQVLSWEPDIRQGVMNKLEYGFKSGEEAGIFEAVNQALARLGDVGAVPEQVLNELPSRLVAAKNHNEQVLVLRQALFVGDENEVPKNMRKYLDMLQRGKTIDQVVNDLMQTHQKVWSNIRELETKRQRLNELRRAQSAYLTQKAQKAELRQRAIILETVPDSVYSIPPCSVCGAEVNSEKFFSCVICSILGLNEMQPLYHRIYCSIKCQEEGSVRHRRTHRCAAGVQCIDYRPPVAVKRSRQQAAVRSLPMRSFQPKPQPSRPLTAPQQRPESTAREQRNGDARRPSQLRQSTSPRQTRSVTKKTVSFKQTSPDPQSSSSSEQACDLRFCTECMTALKQPTHWCSLACATKNFGHHRKEVHLPERQKLGIITVDERGVSDHDNYERADVERLTFSMEHGISEWRERFLLDVHLPAERQSC